MNTDPRSQPKLLRRVVEQCQSTFLYYADACMFKKKLSKYQPRLYYCTRILKKCSLDKCPMGNIGIPTKVRTAGKLPGRPRRRKEAPTICQDT